MDSISNLFNAVKGVEPDFLDQEETVSGLFRAMAKHLNEKTLTLPLDEIRLLHTDESRETLQKAHDAALAGDINEARDHLRAYIDLITNEIGKV